MIKAVFFDLDGTLLPMNEDEFIKIYFKLLAKRLMPLGYNPDDLIKVIWGGTNAMFNNDGSKTNEEVFWQYFLDFYGEDKIKSDRKIIDEFYTNEFKLTKNSCFENPLAREIIDYCKSKGLFIGLSTNPIFPKAGTLTRMSFVNLKEEDFDFVTTYEDSYFCKPNPRYFIELLKKYELSPNEVILFGNNTYEDGDCSYYAGIKCYLVGNHIIDNPLSQHTYEHIKMEEVISTIEEHFRK